MRQMTGKFVSHLLDDNQTQNRLSVCKDLQDEAKKGTYIYL